MLVKKVNEDRVLEIADRLGDLLLNGNDQHRDFASIALKTFFLEVTTMSVSQQILVSLIPQLLGRNKYCKFLDPPFNSITVINHHLHHHESLIPSIWNQLKGFFKTPAKPSLNAYL